MWQSVQLPSVARYLPRSTPAYDALAAAAVTTLDGGIKVFAGQRDDPFFVDLGSIFDLAGLRPFNSAHVIPLPNTPGVDSVAGFNTHSIALQIPIANLTKDDVTAIAVFLKSIPAVKNKVPGPFGANDKATEFVMKVVPGEGKK